jgi:hypothetical protein
VTNEFNPQKSLFGRHNYAFEQAILRSVQNETDKAFATMDPDIIRLNLPMIRLVPIHKRREIILKRLDNSIKLLNSMGV